MFKPGGLNERTVEHGIVSMTITREGLGDRQVFQPIGKENGPVVSADVTWEGWNRASSRDLCALHLLPALACYGVLNSSNGDNPLRTTPLHEWILRIGR